MAEYIDQKTIISLLEQHGSSLASYYDYTMPETICFRIFSSWYYNQDNTQFNSNDPKIYVLANQTNYGGNSFDIISLTNPNLTYRSFSGRNQVSNVLQVHSWIDPGHAQVGWRSFSYLQGEEVVEGTSYHLYPPLTIDCPVFDNVDDGFNWGVAVQNYLDDPSSENLKACREALKKSLNPTRGKTKDPNIDRDPNGTTDDIPVGDPRRGGNGNHNYSTDTIGLPTLPTLTATSTGFVTLYRCTEAILRTLADKLFTDTWAGAWDNFWQNADEAIAGLSIVPFQPPVNGRAKPRVGMYTLDVAMDVISSQYVEIDCGEIEVEEFYGSAFDYSPYTKISIYLPYVGVRSLDVDEVMNRRIGVKYYCDAYSGSCMAVIYVLVDPQTGDRGTTPTVKYTFSGNIAQQVPTAAASWDRMIQSGIALACVALPAIAAAAGAVGSGLMNAGIYQATTANASAYGTSQYAKNAVASSWQNAGSPQASMALEGATMSTGMSAKPIVERTGSLGSGVGFLGPQKPFIILEIPRQSIPVDYMKFMGYPSNESATLGDLEGYVQVEDIHLTEVYATGPEKDEIMKLLKEGVIL